MQGHILQNYMNVARMAWPTLQTLSDADLAEICKKAWAAKRAAEDRHVLANSAGPIEARSSAMFQARREGARAAAVVLSEAGKALSC